MTGLFRTHPRFKVPCNPNSVSGGKDDQEKVTSADVTSVSHGKAFLSSGTQKCRTENFLGVDRGNMVQETKHVGIESLSTENATLTLPNGQKIDLPFLTVGFMDFSLTINA